MTSPESWADRYSGTRLPPMPLSLKAPLRRAWRYKAKGQELGFLRAGFGVVVSTMGRGTSCLDLGSGKPVWKKDVSTGALLRWHDDLLIGLGDRDGLLVCDPRSGDVRSERSIPAGMRESFVASDLLVVHTANAIRIVDLVSGQELWSVEEWTKYPVVSDGSVLLRAPEDVTCFDLRTGIVRWNHSGADLGGGAYQMGFIWRDRFVVRIGDALLLTAFELTTGKTVWRTDFPVQWCQPYGDRAYGIGSKGLYQVLDLETGAVAFRRQVAEVPMPRGPKPGLTVAPTGGYPWRDARLAISETHAFIQRPSGQIIVLTRDTGDVEQVVEIDGMPVGRTEPVIYQNHLLLTDFNASVYCFEGAA